MIVQLQPEQISGYWEAIKHSMITINRIPEVLQRDYAIKILERLLSGKLQCWVGYTINEEGERLINLIYTTSILGQDEWGFSVMSMETVYGFRRIPMEMYEEGISALKKFAKATGCEAIIGRTRSKRAREVMLANGFEEQHVVYRLPI